MGTTGELYAMAVSCWVESDDDRASDMLICNQWKRQVVVVVRQSVGSSFSCFELRFYELMSVFGEKARYNVLAKSDFGKVSWLVKP